MGGEVSRLMEKANPVQWVLAVLLVLGFLSVPPMLFFFEMPEANREPVAIMFGGLSAMCSSVVNFFFGSSQGSKDKTTALAKAAAVSKQPGTEL